MLDKSIALLASLALATGLAGCRVHVDKGTNGEDKNVQVDTPFGGLHVNTDQTSAADLGLPVYPGAEMVKDDEHKSADVHMGFGEWQLRVRAVSYGTADTQDKVVAFYKKALGRYGDVISCQGKMPVGTPATTSEGLTCEDEHGNSHNVKIDDKDIGGEKSFQLKAGSKRHQHIVGFDNTKAGQTRFSLVALDLPTGMSSSDKSD